LSRPLLTVLTDPVPFGIYFPAEIAKHLLRKVKRWFRPIPHYMVSSYRGHPAVTRSLVEGLEKIHASANYNPRFFDEIGETVLVLSGIPALKQAIRLKRKGYIKKLLAGPNMVEMPSDYESLAASPELDLYVINCEWTKKMYEDDCPDLIGRCVIWPAGVDTDYWKPDSSQLRETILIYEKQRKGPVGPVEPYKKWIEEKGYKVQVIKCGEYSLPEFLNALQRAQLMVGFVIDESQGLAWAEAWSADVTTLIWRNTSSSIRGRILETSTAPFLTDDNGLFFDDFENFKIVFLQWESMKSSFQPRQWVLEHMSDEACARLFCQLASVKLPA
jgi:hypothetical protein